MAKNLDRKIDTEAFLQSIRPEIPPMPKKTEEVKEKSINTEVETETETTIEAGTKKQTALSKEEMQTKDKEYLRLFINETPTPARSGKATYIRSEYHERIARIVHSISKDRMTFSGYLDYVLTHHFEEYEDSIRRLYKKNYQDIY